VPGGRRGGALPADPAVKAGGLCGLNGLFTGLGLGFFLRAEPSVWFFVVLGSALAAVLTIVLATALRAWSLPPLAAPFVITTWLLLLVVRGWNERPSSELASLQLLAGFADTCRAELATSHGLITASVRGIGQVLFQDSVLSGLIILLGIALNSRISALAAIFGATAGTITVIVLGSTDPALCHGAYGFHAALPALGFRGPL